MRSLLLAALLASGCGTKACKDKTVLVSLTLSGATAQADMLDVTVEVGAEVLTATVPHTGVAAEGTFEIQFPNGYPANQMIRISITARQGSTVLGTGLNDTTLDHDCATLPIVIGPSSDLAMPLDSAGLDLEQSDLTATPDLSVCGMLNQPCCGTTCTQGYCVSNTCQSCGGLGVACCVNNTCTTGAICSAGTCAACGGTGQPCCVGDTCAGSGCCSNSVCISPGSTCAGGKICQGGMCV
jgi:hypothetical protein